MTRGALSGWCVFMVLVANGLASSPSAHAQSTLPATVAATQRSSPPAGTALHLAQRQLEELRSHPGRRYTPAELLKLATESSTELKYAAAMAAMHEAISARQVAVAQQARDLIVKSFDTPPAKIDHMLAKALADAQLAVPAAVVTIRSIEGSLSSGDIRTAHEFSALLMDLVPGLPEDLKLHSKECLADLRTASGLQTRAGSQPASSSSGLFECLYLGQWKENLQRVAGGNGDLALCARQDLNAPDLRSRFASAETWWLTGHGKGNIEGWRVAARAMQIYDDILPQLSGVDRELVLSRKSEHFRRYIIRNAYRQGIAREVSRNGASTRELCTSLELPKDAEGIPNSGARVIYRGLILAEFAGHHELALAGGSGMRVIIDGNELVNNPTAYRKRSGEKIELNLSEGLHSFEIELWSNSSKPRLSAKWSTPAHAEPQVIPAAMLFTDPLASDMH